MIKTIRPFGAINESCIAGLAVSPDSKRFFALDVTSTLWKIDRPDFESLCRKGFQVKEVKVK